MKKITIIGIIALIITGCILTAGCTTQTTNNTQPQTDTETTPDRTDYSNMDNWMLYPAVHLHHVDVIYFYPTVFASDETYTGPQIADPVMRLDAAKSYAHQGSAFETVADVYVPYYREHTPAQYGAAIGNDGTIDNSKLDSYGKTDVFDALDYYFTHANEGRPFILAGHSQGTIQLQDVLTEYMPAHPKYYKNMVAAYALGLSINKTILDENPHLKAAQAADDTGVIVSWNTETAGNPKTTGSFKNPDAIVINPLNWKTDSTYAGTDENHGTLVLLEDGSYGIVPGLVDAVIQDGAIIVNQDPQNSASKTLSKAMTETIKVLNGDYCRHMDDYDFFYQNIRENAALRTASFLKAKNIQT